MVLLFYNKEHCFLNAIVPLQYLMSLKGTCTIICIRFFIIYFLFISGSGAGRRSGSQTYHEETELCCLGSMAGNQEDSIEHSVTSSDFVFNFVLKLYHVMNVEERLL